MMRTRSSPASSCSSRRRPSSSVSPGSRRPAGTCVPESGSSRWSNTSSSVRPSRSRVTYASTRCRTTSRLGALPCRRASSPGIPRAPAPSPRPRASDGWGRDPGRPRLRSRFASTEPSALIFISPKPGSAAMRARRSAPSAASFHKREASPSYSCSTRRASCWTRSAIEPGKRWIAGFSRKASSSVAGSVAAILPGSSVPSRCLSLSGPEKADCTDTCWSSAKPTSSANGSDASSASASSLPVKWSFWTATAMPRILRLERGTVGR